MDTLRELETALGRAKQSREELDQQMDATQDDIIQVNLEVCTVAMELRRRRELEEFIYERHIITLSCVVHAGTPTRLDGVPCIELVWMRQSAGYEDVA